MEKQQAVKSDRVDETSTKVFEIGRVSEETKGIAKLHTESPGVHPGQFPEA